MRRTSLVSVMIVMGALGTATPALAQNAHTWVANNGTNNSSCNFATPCLTFTQALAVTNPGGLISCMTSGQFGSISIAQALTIDCAEVDATIQLLSISTGASDVVVLRGLDFDLHGLTNATTSPGVINFTGAGSLYLERVTINNLRGDQTHGVNFAPSGPAALRIANTTIANIGTGGIIAGIMIRPASGGVASVNIENSRIHHNYFGIIADGSAGGTIRGVVSNSNVSENFKNGITVSTTGSSVVLGIDNTTIANNTFGLVASGNNAGMLVSRSFVTANATGLFTGSGGLILSYRDNRVNGNTTTDGAFTGPVGLQ